MEGFCTMQIGGIKGWAKRYLKIDGSNLKIYKKDKKTLVETIDLKQATLIDVNEQSKRPFAFLIELDKVFVFAANNDEECNEWVAKLKKAKTGVDSTSSVMLSDFKLLKVIGRGGYGKVQLARHIKTGKLYALKSISKITCADCDLIERTISERNILLTANHPFIVYAKYAFQTDTKLFLATEYVPGGELYTRISEERTFSLNRVRLYAAQLALAIGYLHSHGIIHRDLKPENILIDRNGYLKLTDFGLVKKGMKSGETTETFCGTPDYVAPEMILGKPYDKSVDWWAYGCLVYEMANGLPPFYNENTNDMYYSILSDPIEVTEDADDILVDFIVRLLNRDPKARLGSSDRDYLDVIEHAFFDDVNFDDLLKEKIPMEWKPNITDDLDVSQFDEQYTEMEPNLTYEDPSVISTSLQENFIGFSCINDSHEIID
ncbi:AGC family protein kinase [Histomonas meleagridis]|uniref:AGC family protein kinase n=1 Tax=Histomonas meleagridis TaxID=135588 RepID=UPI00355AA85B|nr:AGC family protein kinase [Histomonas meleagridis]KAH0800922.1 AGC family protein kinase [Histomonas meleagridis]